VSARKRDRGELLTLSEAADLFGLARSTVRRALDAGRFPNAEQDDDPRGAWRVPVQDLLDAGYTLPAAPVAPYVTPQDAPVAPLSDAPVAPHVTPQDDTPTVALVPWSDVAHLVDRLAEQQDARASAERDAQVAAFRQGQAERERDRLAEQAEQVRAERDRLADELRDARAAAADATRAAAAAAADRERLRAEWEAAQQAAQEQAAQRRRWGRGKRE
jgi:hypothetical protein